MTHATWALQSHNLSGEGIKLQITDILFWPHKDMKGLPGRVISPMPGPPQRQHKQERQYTPIHTNKANMEWWLRWPNDIWGPCGPKVSQHVLQVSKNPEKTSPRKLVPTGDRTPLHDKRACYHLLHSGGLYCEIILQTFGNNIKHYFSLMFNN